MQMTVVNQTNEAVEDARARHGFYTLASRVFVKEVDLALLYALRGRDMQGALSGRLLQGFAGRDDEGIIEELGVEFATCFLAAGAFLSPYESVQSSKEGLLCGPAASQVAEFYGKAGFSVQDGSALFADHIGIELEFMGHLCALEASSLERGDEDGARRARKLQAEFMDRHLGRWYRPFLQKASKAMEHAFYREFASVTEGFLDSEQEYMRHEH